MKNGIGLIAVLDHQQRTDMARSKPSKKFREQRCCLSEISFRFVELDMKPSRRWQRNKLNKIQNT